MEFDVRAWTDTVVPSWHFNEDKEKIGNTSLWSVESPTDIRTGYVFNTSIEKHDLAKFVGHV
jgi:hypothetical protein